MWGNLAGRLANTDLNAALEKIGNAVAPREGGDHVDDDDDDEEGDYEDDYEDGDDDDDQEEYDDDDDDDGNNNNNNTGPTFGLVGFLARTLQTDNNNNTVDAHEEDNNNNSSDENGDKSHFTYDYNTGRGEPDDDDDDDDDDKEEVDFSHPMIENDFAATTTTAANDNGNNANKSNNTPLFPPQQQQPYQPLGRNTDLSVPKMTMPDNKIPPSELFPAIVTSSSSVRQHQQQQQPPLPQSMVTTTITTSTTENQFQQEVEVPPSLKNQIVDVIRKERPVQPLSGIVVEELLINKEEKEKEPITPSVTHGSQVQPARSTTRTTTSRRMSAHQRLAQQQQQSGLHVQDDEAGVDVVPNTSEYPSESLMTTEPSLHSTTKNLDQQQRQRYHPPSKSPDAIPPVVSPTTTTSKSRTKEDIAPKATTTVIGDGRTTRLYGSDSGVGVSDDAAVPVINNVTDNNSLPLPTVPLHPTINAAFTTTTTTASTTATNPVQTMGLTMEQNVPYGIPPTSGLAISTKVVTADYDDSPADRLQSGAAGSKHNNNKKDGNHPILQQSNTVVVVLDNDNNSNDGNHENEMMKKALQESDAMCQDLQMRLVQTEQAMEVLKHRAEQQQAQMALDREALIAQFQQKEERILQATTEENNTMTYQIQQEYQSKIQLLEQSLLKERAEMKDEVEEYKKLVRESDTRVDKVEKQLRATTQKYENDSLQAKQKEERSIRKVEDRLAQTMAILDVKNDEITQMKKLIRTMESKVTEHAEGAEEAEEEVEELHQENATLQRKIDSLETDCKRLKHQVETLEGDSDKYAGLQLELRMLKEELVRERTKSQSVVDSALTTHTRTESERDAALSELHDLQQQLSAALADLEVAKADSTRITTANTNLQSALEAFQEERQAEMRMLYDQRQEWEDAITSANATAMTALRQTHDTKLYEVQKAGEVAVKNVVEEMELLRGIIEKLKSENFQLRRSLDEAIHRLQTTQEDVVDRDVMKNILLDWCTLKEKSKRHQVLQIMANLLHFSDEEKDRVNLMTGLDLDSMGAKVVGAFAAPLPPSKADVEHLEGDNVREKWINFLLAETDDS